MNWSACWNHLAWSLIRFSLTLLRLLTPGLQRPFALWPARAPGFEGLTISIDLYGTISPMIYKFAFYLHFFHCEPDHSQVRPLIFAIILLNCLQKWYLSYMSCIGFGQDWAIWELSFYHLCRLASFTFVNLELCFWMKDQFDVFHVIAMSASIDSYFDRNLWQFVNFEECSVSLTW